MSVSDVLSDAIDTIDEYLADEYYHELYKARLPEIAAVRSSMETLRIKLDSPGSCEWVPRAGVPEAVEAERRVRGVTLWDRIRGWFWKPGWN